jgi:hypothetical protein
VKRGIGESEKEERKTREQTHMRKGLIRTILRITFIVLFSVSTSYAQYICTESMFDDVDEASVGLPFCHFIERFAALGITGGCLADPPLYCPDNYVTRSQMAVFLTSGLDRIEQGISVDSAGDITVKGDIITDRWLNSDTNTFLGVGVAGGGNLSHGSGMEGWGNTAIGIDSLYSNTTGYWNIALGSAALYSNTTGIQNLAMGRGALYSNTTGGNNIALASLALNSNTEGTFNTALGHEALYQNTTGGSNCALGPYALSLNTVGSFNTALGREAGVNSHGDGNVFLGYRAGFLETGSDRLYIANSNSSTLIYGQFDAGRVCINCTDPSAALDVNGTVRVRSAQSSLWISGNGVRKYRESDSTVINMDTVGGAVVTRGATTGAKNVMLPITIMGPIYGQQVTITNMEVWFKGQTEFDALSAVLLRRQKDVCEAADCYDSLVFDLSDHACDASNFPRGCKISFTPTGNNILTEDHGPLYVTLELGFSGSATQIWIGGVRLTLRHE